MDVSLITCPNYPRTRRGRQRGGDLFVSESIEEYNFVLN